MGCTGSKETKKPSVKVALMGSVNTGKTTFIKQMTYEFDGGFDELTCAGFKADVHYNVLRFLGSVLATADIEVESFYEKQVKLVKDLYAKYASRSEESWSVEVLMLEDHLSGNREAVDALVSVSKMKQLRTYLESEKDLIDHPEIRFLDDIDKVFSGDYHPSKAHILRVRLPTIGRHDYEFDTGDLVFEVKDVIGSKSKEWMEDVDRADAVVFITDVADYKLIQQTVEEKGKEKERVTGLEASLHLFERVARTAKGKGKDVFVLLNKTDALAAQHERPGGDPADHVAGYEPQVSSPDAFLDHLKGVYSGKNNAKDQVHVLPLCALESKSFNTVFSVLLDQITKRRAMQ